MLAHALGVIEKTRYEIEFQGAYWEIDVFAGAYLGLETAEIELADPDHWLLMPPWLGPEISGNPHYSNRGLALKSARSVLRLREVG
jgi:adenylate cyclase